MGRSYKDIKYDLWYNLEKIGIPREAMRLVVAPQPGKTIFGYGLRPVIGINTDVTLGKSNLGEGFFFNGSSSEIVFGEIGLTRTAAQPLTTIASGHMTASNGGEIFGCRSGSGAGDLWKLYRIPSTGLGFQYDPTGSGGSVNSSISGDASFWYKVAGRYNGDTIDIIAETDRVQITKNQSASKPNAAIDQDNYTIGGRPDGLGSNLQGFLFGVELYSHALTDTQIQRRFNVPGEIWTPRPNIFYFKQATSGSTLLPIKYKNTRTQHTNLRR